MDAENKKPGGLRKSSLVQAWLVLVLAVGFGVSLAGVQLALGPVIESNKINETLEKVKKSDRAKFYSVYEARYQDGLKGWVVKTKGQGYADTIELLLGLSPDLRTITGLFVLDQKETPGLGNKIITDAWRGQFIDAPADKPLIVVKTGASRPGEIDAVTGATISSRSVTAMINTAIGDLRKPLTAGPSAAGKGGKNNG
ncbi:MAG: FMN-binding protein [Desulfosarcina sp.]|nr:FMN-binding protein [Desulfosarcina sp.]